MVWTNNADAYDVARLVSDRKVVGIHLPLKHKRRAQQLAKELFGYRGAVLDSGEFISIVRLPYEEIKI